MESSSRSVTDVLSAEIRKSINVLSPAHWIAPTDGEIVDNHKDGYIKNWAFTQGFRLVKESGRPERLVLYCSCSERYVPTAGMQASRSLSVSAKPVC